MSSVASLTQGIKSTPSLAAMPIAVVRGEASPATPSASGKKIIMVA